MTVSRRPIPEIIRLGSSSSLTIESSSNGCVADFVTALANVEGQLSMLVIDLTSQGCRVGDPDIRMGNKGQLTSDIYFENVEVPEENLIGISGKDCMQSWER